VEPRKEVGSYSGLPCFKHRDIVRILVVYISPPYVYAEIVT